MTTIKVQGIAEHEQPPERATAHLRVGLRGPKQSSVHDDVAAVLRELRASIERLHDPGRGPVTWFSVSGVSGWSYKEDKRTVYTEQIRIQVKFCDFTVLGAWLNEVLGWKGVSMFRIDWSVTEVRRKELEKGLRLQAVRVAREKAEQYASAVGLSITDVSSIRDFGPGVDTAAFIAGASVRGRGGSAGSAPADDSYSFAPEDVTLRAAVVAKFVAE